MSDSQPDGRGMAEGPVASRVPPKEARVSGLLASIPIGLMVGYVVRSGFNYEENGHAMALVLLAVVPFLIALAFSEADGVMRALGITTPLGIVSAAITALPLGPFVILAVFLSPALIGIALIMGLAALATSYQRANDGSLALAVLGLSPAASCLVVFLADAVIAQILGLPQGRINAPPRPMMVLVVAIAITVLAPLAVALLVRSRRPAAPSKPEARRGWDEFDRE